MTKFDHKDTTYQLIVQELWKFTAKPMVWRSSFESDTTETPFSNFSQLRSSLKWVIKYMKESHNIPTEFIELSRELLQILAESQILLELAEDVSTRAVVLNSKLQIALAIQEESQVLSSELQVTPKRLMSHMLSSRPDGTNCLHPLQQSSLRFNAHLRALLIGDIQSSPNSGFDFRRNKKELDELLSLRRAEDSTAASGISSGVLDPEWIPFERLYFPAKPELEKNHEKESWLQKVVQFFTEPESSGLELSPGGLLRFEPTTRLRKSWLSFVLVLLLHRPQSSRIVVSDFLVRPALYYRVDLARQPGSVPFHSAVCHSWILRELHPIL
jgi:hypothetical protein